MSDNEHEQAPPPAPESGESGPSPAVPTAVVGLCGSAGALEGYEQFFAGLPPGSGMAFVVVSHLDPGARGIMPELLARCTPLPVSEVEDGRPALPDHVYVVPPGKTLSIMRGTLLLNEEQRSGDLPIDAFLRDLAADQGERAVAVILSGTGTDGTAGVRAVKDGFGLAFVQDPNSAQYRGMPQSAVSTGLADAVLPPDELAATLYSRVTSTRSLTTEDVYNEEGRAGASLQKILLTIRSRCGQDLSGYKHTTLVRRIDRQMRSHGMSDVAAYARFLQETPGEAEELFRDLLINVTSFFRDAAAFEVLAEQLRSHLAVHGDELETFRVWVAGCSTGEEAYSVAMLLNEVLGATGHRHVRAQIFATDIDQEAVAVARVGWYPEQVSYVVSPERLERYFTPRDGGYQVRSEIRELVVFAVHNTFGDPPFTRLDLLCCRNMLIYLGNDLQKRVLSLFHYALKPGGLLFLGPSESTGSARDLFQTLDNRWKLYRRGSAPAVPLPPPGQGTPPSRVPFPVTVADLPRSPRPPRETDVAGTVQNLLLSDWTPPAVVVDRSGDLMYATGRTGPYLELPAGRVNPNVLDMAREGLRFELSEALREADEGGGDVTREGVTVRTREGLTLTFDLIVQPIRRPNLRPGLFLVVFRDQGAAVPPVVDAAGDGSGARMLVLERELQYTRDYLQASVEEMEVSVEELRSTNEELQTANEELQSTNEELTTSKEELQSLNEELITINSEHQMIINDLAQANDNIKNLLDGAGIATMFLDNNLRIKRFTPRITSLVNLIPADVGRPVTDIAPNLRYDRLVEDVREVLATLTPVKAEVETKDGHWYLMSISPYRTFDNFIDGVVILFSPTDDLRRLQTELRVSRLQTESIVETIRDPLVLLDDDLRVVSFNQALPGLWRRSPGQMRGMRLYDLGNGEFDRPELRERLERLIYSDEEVMDFLVEWEGLGTPRVLKLNARHLVTEDKAAALVLLMAEDVTELLRRAEREGVQGAVEGQGPEAAGDGT